MRGVNFLETGGGGNVEVKDLGGRVAKDGLTIEFDLFLKSTLVLRRSVDTLWKDTVGFIVVDCEETT